MVIFGGATDFEVNGVMKSKICLRNIWTFDLATKIWSEIHIEGQDLQGRQNMAMCIHESCLYIHGGYKMFKNITDEFYKFDLRTKKWT